MQTLLNTTAAPALVTVPAQPVDATANVATPPASPFSTNANTDDARKATAKASLSAKTSGKRSTAKPATKAKPAKAGKAAKPAKPSNDRSAVIASGRQLASTRYNGPSLAVRRSGKLYSASDYANRFRDPIQRTSVDKLTVRDESHLIVMLGARTAGFDPAALNIDLGGFSRLCSVGAIKLGDKPALYMLTPAGASLARKAKAATAKAA